MPTILLLIQAAAALLPALEGAIPAVKSIIAGTGTPDDEAALQAVVATLMAQAAAREEAAGATG